MKLNSIRTKVTLIVLVVLLFISIFINLKSKIIVERLIAEDIIDLKIEIFFANGYAQTILDSSLTERVRSDAIARLIYSLSYISKKVPHVYSMYYNDESSNSLGIEFNSELNKFYGFLDENRKLIATDSLNSEGLDVLEENIEKLSELNKIIDRLNRYTDTEKRYNLISSFFLRKTHFKELLYEAVTLCVRIVVVEKISV